MPRKKGVRAKKENPRYRENPTAITWMWAGVISFSIIIIALWGWAIKIQLSTFRWQTTPENKLMQDSEQYWSDLFNTEQEKLRLETAKTELKSAIDRITASASTTEATVTGTISSTTTISAATTTPTTTIKNK